MHEQSAPRLQPNRSDAPRERRRLLPLLSSQKPPVTLLFRRLCLQPLCFEDFASRTPVPPSVTSVNSRLCVPTSQKLHLPTYALVSRRSRPYSRLGTATTMWGTEALECPAARVSGATDL